MTDVASRPFTKRATVARLALAFSCAFALAIGTAVPAEAVAMKFVAGNIRCFAYPNVSVGTSAMVSPWEHRRWRVAKCTSS